MDTKETVKRLMFWVALAALFNVGIYFFMGKQCALEFLGGYILEQSLSLDNLFIFLLIFTSFGIQPIYQKRVLSWGIIGAMILRFIFIFLGITIINKFHWILYIFGVVLVASGIKMLFGSEKQHDFTKNILFKAIKKFIPVTSRLQGEKFFVRKNKTIYVTPLFVILLIIESSDIMFAIDSIPAVFSITTNPFIVYTSNIFAVICLRNMYFILEKLKDVFRFVKYGVGLILVFIGIKLGMLLFNMEIAIMPSLAVIFGLLASSIIMSIVLKEE